MTALRVRVWSVEPDRHGGYHVTCNGQSREWFRMFPRAVAEAQRNNAAERAYIERLRRGVRP